MPKAKATPKPIEELSFEAALAEMEDLIRQLENGQLALDESLALFERGQLLAARCQQLLATAELKVQQLLPGIDGGYNLQPFEDGER
jgi:exodeoxyribonuclease VII small subunit